MVFGWFKSEFDDVQEEVKSLQERTKQAFHHIKREFDDHLSAINQNTAEIQSVYDFLSDLDRRLDKVTERVDELQMKVNPEMEDIPEIDLTLREQEVFFVLYTKSDPISCKEIGRQLGFTPEMVNKYVYNMISKGVPVMRDDTEEDLVVHLDNGFRTLQAKREVVDVDQGIRRQFARESEQFVRSEQ
jgi:DNA-binding CsgD family transcriptional regulator